MRFETESASGPTLGQAATPSRRRLLTGSVAALVLAGTLAFATPAFAQDDADTDDTTAETTVTTDDSEGTTVEVGATGDDTAETEAAAETAVEAEGATGDDAAVTEAAPATGAAGTTALPSTGVGPAEDASLPLIGLAAAGAVAAGAVAVNRARPAGRRS